MKRNRRSLRQLVQIYTYTYTYKSTTYLNVKKLPPRPETFCLPNIINESSMDPRKGRRNRYAITEIIHTAFLIHYPLLE